MLGAPEIVPQDSSAATDFLLFLISDRVCVALPFIFAPSSTLSRTKLLLCPPGRSDTTRDQTTLAGVAASSGGGAFAQIISRFDFLDT